MLSTCLSRHLHELCIAPSELVLGDTYVVLQIGANRTAASCEHPILARESLRGSPVRESLQFLSLLQVRYPFAPFHNLS